MILPEIIRTVANVKRQAKGVRKADEVFNIEKGRNLQDELLRKVNYGTHVLFLDHIRPT
jgi:hypothetical protein